MDLGAWCGDGAVGTLNEGRRAASRFALVGGGEVVTLLWDAVQALSLARVDNKAAYVWRSVCKQVSTHLAGRDLL